MTDTTTIPDGITRLAEPCWELVYADTGKPWDNGSDGVPHFVSQEEAASVAESLDDEDDPDLDARPRDVVCWTATATCGLPFEDDGGGILHWATEAEALAELRDCGWPVIDGAQRCEDAAACTPTADAKEN